MEDTVMQDAECSKQDAGEGSAMVEREEDIEREEEEEEEEDEECLDAGPGVAGMGELMEREKILSRALVLVSKRMQHNFQCSFHLGLMHFRSQMYTKAKEAFKKALENLRAHKVRKVDPNRWKSLEARLLSLHAQCCLYELTTPGTVATEEHQPSEIQDQLVQATRLDNMQPDVWNNMGLLYMSLNKFDGARAILGPMLRNFAHYSDALANLGLSYLCSDDMSEATRCFQTVILRDSSHLEALNNYGVLLLRQKHYANAVVFFEKAIDVDISQSYVWSNLACAYSGAGRYSDAARAFRHARALDDTNTQATCNLAHHITAMLPSEADLSARADKIQQAEHLYSSLLAHNNSYTQAWTGLATLFKLVAEGADVPAQRHEYASLAMEAFSQAVTSDPCDPVVWIQLGLLSMAAGDYNKAEKCFRTAIMKPRGQGMLGSWCNLGIALQLGDRAAEACKVYTQAVGTFEGSHQLYNNIGCLYRHMNKLQDAQSAYETSLGLKKECGVTLNNLGLLYIAVDRLNDAHSILARATLVDGGLECARSNALKLRELERRQADRLKRSGPPAAGDSSSAPAAHAAAAAAAAAAPSPAGSGGPSPAGGSKTK